MLTMFNRKCFEKFGLLSQASFKQELEIGGLYRGLSMQHNLLGNSGSRSSFMKGLHKQVVGEV